jgi:hypothetical protein
MDNSRRDPARPTPPNRPLPERQERALLVALEHKHLGVMVTENGHDLLRRAVPSRTCVEPG